MLSKEQRKKVDDVIKSLGHGEEFYTPQMKEELYARVGETIDSLGLSQVSDEKKAFLVNKHIMEKVEIRPEYFYAFNTLGQPFDESEVYYRTAHAALYSGQAMCAGYAEAVRVLLETSGVKTHTLLAKLPSKNKQLMHYVVCAECKLDNGKLDYVILDPERQKSCIKKGYDFQVYMAGMTFVMPDEVFDRQKVGSTGVGPRFCDYYKENVPPLATVETIADFMRKAKAGNFDPMGSGR